MFSDVVVNKNAIVSKSLLFNFNYKKIEKTFVMMYKFTNEILKIFAKFYYLISHKIELNYTISAKNQLLKLLYLGNGEHTHGTRSLWRGKQISTISINLTMDYQSKYGTYLSYSRLAIIEDLICFDYP